MSRKLYDLQPYAVFNRQALYSVHRESHAHRIAMLSEFLISSLFGSFSVRVRVCDVCVKGFAGGGDPRDPRDEGQ